MIEKTKTNLYQIIPNFNYPEDEGFWKRHRQSRKCIFSFCHKVFYPFQIKLHYFSHVYFVVCQMLSIWTGLKFCPLETKKGWCALCPLSHTLNKTIRYWLPWMYASGKVYITVLLTYTLMYLKGLFYLNNFLVFTPLLLIPIYCQAAI